MGETQQPNLSSGDTNKEFVVVQEGKAKVGFHGPVFYNPVQEFNRDLTQPVHFSVSVLREFVNSRMVNGSSADGEKCNEGPKAKKAKMLFEKEVRLV
ncbi:hypothetical protein TELCIR_04597 [Teladorsagia circumcincta]|uniref:Uncharacterized protein n=1 Tax=Teladorsagia circumcincta TaxID=45464 RepID=A0A2G9UT67_TELCI|nr:hypothetical protein TELCIR_04597 [Teladorsagia circumcincta]